MSKPHKPFRKTDGEQKTDERTQKSHERLTTNSMREMHIHRKDHSRREDGCNDRIGSRKNARENPQKQNRERHPKPDERKHSAPKPDGNRDKRKQRKEPRK